MRAAQARVLLTGASGGIGQAMLQQLQAAGAQVMGVGRHPFALANSAVGQATAHGNVNAAPPAWVCADLTQEDDLSRVATQASAWGAPTRPSRSAGSPTSG
jgi:NAD(P)-dependent dehydrogenase (short-subunit alcohol dehydrogenase family)